VLHKIGLVVSRVEVAPKQCVIASISGTDWGGGSTAFSVLDSALADVHRNVCLIDM